VEVMSESGLMSIATSAADINDFAEPSVSPNATSSGMGSTTAHGASDTSPNTTPKPGLQFRRGSWRNRSFTLTSQSSASRW